MNQENSYNDKKKIRILEAVTSNTNINAPKIV